MEILFYTISVAVCNNGVPRYNI